MRYGTPRQYLVLRAIRDEVPALGDFGPGWDDAVVREVQDELVKLGWLQQVTPHLNQRFYSVTRDGEAAIGAYEVNPSYSGVTREKWWLDRQRNS